MKKLILIVTAVLLIASCGPSKTAVEARKTLKGDWVLKEVSYPNNPGIYNVTLFNDSSVNCFNGSRWDFVSNNNTGTYALQGTDCPAEQRYFRWSIDEENTAPGTFDFLLKPTNSKYKSVTGGEGFRLNLLSLTATSMILEQTVTFEGKPFVIRMNFSKL